MIEQNLQYKDNSENVKILQGKLKILGFYHALINGEFNLATQEGVKAFQKQYQLEETGIVNEETWNLLFELTEPAIATISLYPTLQYGSSGEYVKDLQTKLRTMLYYTGPINKTFDSETEVAVKRFQEHNDLTASGIVNNQTWDLINSLYGNIAPCVIDNNTDQNKYITYKVVYGDTLYQIAKEYNTSVEEIKKLNNLTNNTITVGQILKIPTSSNEDNSNNEQYISYTVEKGDTLYQIAKEYNTTVEELKRINDLISNTLSIGQVLKIPTSSNEDNSNNEQYISYTVVRGDTLYQIARKYNTTVEELKKINNLISNTLSIGQILKIPVKNNSESYINYIVEKGDTLYQIARKYNTTVEELKKINNLVSNILSIGQVLKIPN